jgi:branched-chain amino acid transport system ATP-binding protein
MALLEIKDVRRSFGGLVAVNRVSFSVNPGRIKAVIGPNGAGKTTLFNIISGLLKPDAGQVTFKDRSITGFKSYQIARAGISRTFQNPSLFLQMNVLENVMVGRHRRSSRGFAACCLRLPGQPREERTIREAALAQLDYVGLARLAGFPAGGLSFGQRRMVELARALATDPELLLLDEPASGLNTREKENLGALIRRIRDRGITVLLVEHDMTLVMDLSDDILVLHDGTVIAEGSPDKIQNDPTVISTYLGGEIRPAEEVELALLTGGQPDAVTGARVVPTRSSPVGEEAVQ